MAFGGLTATFPARRRAAAAQLTSTSSTTPEGDDQLSLESSMRAARSVACQGGAHVGHSATGRSEAGRWPAMRSGRLGLSTEHCDRMP